MPRRRGRPRVFQTDACADFPRFLAAQRARIRERLRVAGSRIDRGAETPAPRALSPSKQNFCLSGKQRSPKQQQIARRLADHTMAVATAQKAAAKVQPVLPKTSWWVNCSRADHQRIAKERVAIMALSPFAGYQGGGHTES